MPPGKPIRILTVEDHPVFREELDTIIGSEPDMLLVGQAANAAQAVTELRRHRPDITLMDLRLPGTNGTDTLITIRGEYPEARITMLTPSGSDGDIQRAMRAGDRVTSMRVQEVRMGDYGSPTAAYCKWSIQLIWPGMR